MEEASRPLVIPLSSDRAQRAGDLIWIGRVSESVRRKRPGCGHRKSALALGASGAWPAPLYPMHQRAERRWRRGEKSRTDTMRIG